VDQHVTYWAKATKSGMEESAIRRMDYAIVPDGATELIGNGDFEDLWMLWNSWANSDAGGSRVTRFTDGAVVTEVFEPGNEEWAFGISYAPGLPMEANTVYSATFTASATESRTIVLRVGERDRDLNGDGERWTNYCYARVTVDTTPKTFSAAFAVPEIADDGADFAFFLGNHSGDVTIDNVSVTSRSAQPLGSALMPDAALRAAIAQELDTTVDELDEADLLTLTELDAESVGISDLTGLERCPYLRKLALVNNSIAELGPVVGLGRIEQMHFQGNPLTYQELTDTITLDNYPNLSHLYLSDDHEYLGAYIDDIIDLLDRFPDLRGVGMADFGLTDAQFSTLYTTVLEERTNRIDSLDLWGNNLGDNSLALLGNLTELRWLSLKGSPVSDLSSLSSLTSLLSLSVGKSRITDLQPLRALHDAGAFSPADEAEVRIQDCGLDLSPGTDNRAVVDYLIGQGIEVEWEEGNTID
jgi:hypothetical protein